ncbi:hypothetical protein M758_3G191500 [Ceratodon purpureus]|uniref:Uncharacterized protein n=1 Tax=Ceratodon purpureus TaxID=3225 RepID=A0A8T0ILQ7_CERPU|nr:hypothetical protein KC19_3G192100 [Ceratodon purpureus]KAG0623653.1 hypothetical protein M758_3G191500 [Ceratodon purpureus]
MNDHPSAAAVSLRISVSAISTSFMNSFFLTHQLRYFNKILSYMERFKFLLPINQGVFVLKIYMLFDFVCKSCRHSVCIRRKCHCPSGSRVFWTCDVTYTGLQLGD